MTPTDHARAAMQDFYDREPPATRWREGCPPYTVEDSRAKRSPAPTTEAEWDALNRGSSKGDR